MTESMNFRYWLGIMMFLCLMAFGQTGIALAAQSYVVVDTNQSACFDDRAQMNCPPSGRAFYGQDAQYYGNPPRYVDNGDGTISDQSTGLMWQKTPNLAQKSEYSDALAGAASFNLAGYDDWRLPSIKELYSLIEFIGNSYSLTPYLDTGYFDFTYGSNNIDGRYWSSNVYVGTVMGGQTAVFGVNFADGHIKGYGLNGGMQQYVRYVRGNTSYGLNDFVDNGDDTITDQATGLMWQKGDNGSGVIWQEALSYCENLSQAGHDDWRLPNAKELQSIVDYSRAPDASNPAQRGPAIDPIFNLTETESWYWTGTTLTEGPPDQSGSNAVYVAFGQAYGVYSDPRTGETYLRDVHGAGAQRSDPKSGDPADYAEGRGTPGQDDQVRIYNYVRCVRDAQ